MVLGWHDELRLRRAHRGGVVGEPHRRHRHRRRRGTQHTKRAVQHGLALVPPDDDGCGRTRLGQELSKTFCGSSSVPAEVAAPSRPRVLPQKNKPRFSSSMCIGMLNATTVARLPQVVWLSRSHWHWCDDPPLSLFVSIQQSGDTACCSRARAAPPLHAPPRAQLGARHRARRAHRDSHRYLPITISGSMVKLTSSMTSSGAPRRPAM